MKVSQRILQRVGDVSEADLDALEREVEEARAYLARLEAIRTVAWMGQVPAAEEVVVVAAPQSPVSAPPPLPAIPPPAPKPTRQRAANAAERPSPEPSANGHGEPDKPNGKPRGKAASAESGERRRRIAAYLLEHGPTRQYVLANHLDVHDTCVLGLVKDHPWFDKQGGMISLSSTGHQVTTGKGEDD